jgi:hypothetical protein
VQRRGDGLASLLQFNSVTLNIEQRKSDAI